MERKVPKNLAEAQTDLDDLANDQLHRVCRPNLLLADLNDPRERESGIGNMLEETPNSRSRM